MEDFHSLLILMVVVWVMGKIFRQLHLPIIFGELLGGIIVGPLVLNVVDPNSEAIHVLAELGIFFLMLHAGLENDPKKLAKNLKKSTIIATISLAVPFVLSFITAQLFGIDTNQALFIALCISAPAIAISIRILKDYKLQDTKLGSTVLSACIISDIQILIVFSLILSLFETGNINAGAILLMLLKICLFFAVVIFGGLKFQKHVNRFFQNKGFTLTLIVALVLGTIAEMIGLHVIIGAFLAGLFIREDVIDEKVFSKIEDRIYGLSYSFLGPIFFTTLAFSLDFRGISEQPYLFLALFAAAFIGKWLGSSAAAIQQKFSKFDSSIIGLVMNSRGAVDLIIITIGLKKGIIDQNVFSILVVIVFATTLLAILGIRPFKKKLKTIS
jgi:Kef-type K+ transport system membrane component KefB